MSLDRDIWIITSWFLYIHITLININPQTKFPAATITETLKATSYKNLNLEKFGLSPKSVDRDKWIVIPRFLYIPFVLIDINLHTKFQVATIIGKLKSTSFKKTNLSLTGSYTYVHMFRQTYGCMYVRNNVHTNARMHTQTLYAPSIFDGGGIKKQSKSFMGQAFS